jgi:WD40-like Beta Propeller Repeat
MDDLRATLERTRARFPEPGLSLEAVLGRRDARRRRQRIISVAVAVAVAVVGLFVAARALDVTGTPVAPPPLPVYRGGIDVVGPGQGLRPLLPEGGLGPPVALCANPCGPIRGADLSPDGTRLAYTASCFGDCRYDDDGVHVVDLGTGVDRRIAGSGPPGSSLGGIAWSPDGTRLAVVGANGHELLVMSADGSSVRSLPEPPSGGINDPVWSPDGRSIAYTSYPHSVPSGAIMVVPVRGGQTERVAKGVAAVWAPDEAITYLDGQELWRVVPGGPLTFVAALRDCECPVGAYGTHMDRSPDGSLLTILTADRIVVVDPSSGQAVAVASRPRTVDRFVTWASRGDG